MKRPVIIIIGLVVVVILIAVWVYMLFFASGNTASDDNFADLNFGDTTDTNVPLAENTSIQDVPLVDVTAPEIIKQLTTGPVIGVEEVLEEDSLSSLVFYIEPGTGHIFSINLSTGEETRVSGTTIRGASQGVITPNGQYVMIKAGSGRSAEYIVGTIPEAGGEMVTTNLGENIQNFTTTFGNTFLYTIIEGGDLVGKEYNPITDATAILFTLPFTNANIEWGSEATSIHYATPKTNTRLEGYLYEINQGAVSRLPISGFGLSVIPSFGGITYSRLVDGQYQVSNYNKESGVEIDSVLSLLPDKCVEINIGTGLICATDNQSFDFKTPNSWYEGVVTYDDNFWGLDPVGGAASYLVDVESETGRQLDILNPHASYWGDRLYFQNKNDRTLWVYNYGE